VEAIQDVGAYAGFAAVVGLAVLAALYFSQARDLRRLREWAGRAPERAADQAATIGQTPEQAAQDAARPAASGAVKTIPAAKPVTPGKPAPGAPGQPGTEEKKPAAAPAPATAGKPDEKKPAPAPGAAPPVPATAAAAAAKASAGAPAPATPAATPAKDKPAPSGPGDGSEPAATPAPATGGPPPATPPPRPPTPRPVLPARPAPPVRSPAAASASPQSTAVLPASSARLRDRARGAAGRDGLGARYIALIVAGVIVVGGGVAFGVSQLGGDDGASAPDDQAQAPQEPVNPSTVTVSVLNGTTVPGLAAQIGDEIESDGFQRGNVANALDQQRTTSTVLFAEGADREAQLVARKLGITTVEPVDPDSQALGGTASVVVIVGADQTQ
jgi:hypothetical protein